MFPDFRIQPLDDHQVVRSGLQTLIELEDHLVAPERPGPRQRNEPGVVQTCNQAESQSASSSQVHVVGVEHGFGPSLAMESQETEETETMWLRVPGFPRLVAK
jgi:hypothetical protein